jgi:hypothetical protein
MRFEPAGTVASVRWALDGVDFGPAQQLVVWQATPGPHMLSLADDDRRSPDTVRFMVRGAAPVAEF